MLMPMTLWGPSLESLAQQNQNLSQQFGEASRANADAQYRANLTNLQTALGAQQAQQAAAAHQSDQAYQAQQNALAQASHERDVQTQYQGAARDLSQKQAEQDFNQAQKVAASGALPLDEEDIQKQYPHLSSQQVGVLYQLAGKAALDKLDLGISNSVKAHQPPDAGLIKVNGLTGTEWEDAAKAKINASIEPFNQEYTQASDLANTGNRLQALQKDIGTPGEPVTPLPTSSPWETGANWLTRAATLGFLSPPPAVDPSTVMQPTARIPNATDLGIRMAQMQAAMKANPNVQPNPATGAYQSNVPSNWAPQSSLTSTAPAAAPQLSRIPGQLPPPQIPSSIAPPGPAPMPPPPIPQPAPPTGPNPIAVGATAGAGGALWPLWAQRTGTPMPPPPASAPQSAVPTPPAFPAGKLITDKRGRLWLYTGDAPDPTKDKDPTHWQKP